MFDSFLAWISKNKDALSIIVPVVSAFVGGVFALYKWRSKEKAGNNKKQAPQQKVTADHGSIAVAAGDGSTVTIHAPSDTTEIVKALLKSHERELARRDQLEQIQQEEIKDLTAAVARLQACMQNPERPPDLPRAMEELKAGRTETAEDLLRRFAEKQIAAGVQARKEAAEAYRHLGALAFLHDTYKALECYQQAVELDPDDPDGWNRLGHVYLRLGELSKAEDAYNKVYEHAEGNDDQEFRAIAYGNLGLVYDTRGDLGRAERMYNQALKLNQALGSKEDMAIQYGNLGNIFYTRGDLDRA